MKEPGATLSSWPVDQAGSLRGRHQEAKGWTGLTHRCWVPEVHPCHDLPNVSSEAALGCVLTVTGCGGSAASPGPSAGRRLTSGGTCWVLGPGEARLPPGSGSDCSLGSSISLALGFPGGCGLGPCCPPQLLRLGGNSGCPSLSTGRAHCRV